MYFTILEQLIEGVLDNHFPDGDLKTTGHPFHGVQHASGSYSEGSLQFKKIVLNFANTVDAMSPCVYDNAASGRLGDRGPALSGPRKVRTP